MNYQNSKHVELTPVKSMLHILPRSIKSLIVPFLMLCAVSSTASASILYSVDTGTNSFSVTAPSLGPITVLAPPAECSFLNLTCESIEIGDQSWQVNFTDGGILFGYEVPFTLGVNSNINYSGAFGSNQAIFTAYEDFFINRAAVTISEVAVVPEPATLVLIGLGLVAFGVTRRKAKLQH